MDDLRNRLLSLQETMTVFRPVIGSVKSNERRFETYLETLEIPTMSAFRLFDGKPCRQIVDVPPTQSSRSYDLWMNNTTFPPPGHPR